MQVIVTTSKTKRREKERDWATVQDGGTYHLQNSYVYYNLESKATSNFDVTSKKLRRFEIFF